LLSSFYVAVGVFTIGPVLPRIAAAFAHSPLAWLVLWIGSIGAPAFALGSPIAGFAISRIGFRRVFLASIFVWVVAGLTPAAFANPWVLLASRILVGVAAAGALTAGLDGISHLPEAERPFLFGWQAVAGSLAAMAFIPAVGLLAKLSWQASFAIYGVGILIVPLTVSLPRLVSEPTRQATGATRELLAGVGPGMVLFAALVGVCMLVIHLMAPFFLVSIGIPDPAKAAIPLTAMAFASMAAASAYGTIHRIIGTSGAFCVATAVIASGLIVAAMSASLALLTTGTVVMGAGLSVCVANLYTAVSAGRAAEHGAALGVVNGAIYIAPVVLPLLVKPIDKALGAGGIFLILAGFMLACTAAFAARLFGQRSNRAAVGALQR
ncbi:MAG TPA: MFS transporter, partial [Acetobacteraceae bacterium]|nr:MFS transporter [Acetobacteraceae bacterium]